MHAHIRYGSQAEILTSPRMSALPPKADIRQRIEHVCFVPVADIIHRHELRYNAITLWHYGDVFFGGAS